MRPKGNDYGRFTSALRTGNLALVHAAAAELPRVELADALEICLLMADQGDDRYDRAAVRWVARFALEAPHVTVDDLRLALVALEALPYNPQAARATLAGVCRGQGHMRAAEALEAAERAGAATSRARRLPPGRSSPPPSAP